MATQVEIRSETLYDALIDGWSLVRRVLAAPSTPEELARAEGLDVDAVERRLRPIVEAGVLRRDGARIHPVATAVRTSRHEGMVSSLSFRILPLVTELVREPATGLLLQLDLVLDREEQAALRTGPVQQLLEELTAISDAEAAERRPHTAVIVGTSDVPPAADSGDRSLETIRRAARQRSLKDDSARAVLTYAEGLFGTEHAKAAEAAMRRFADRFAPQLAGERKPTYTILLALGARAGAQGVNS